MRATVMHGAGDVRVENVPDAGLIDPTDAVVRVTHASICGSDLWPYAAMEPSASGQSMGHEAIGVVEAVGANVSTIGIGDRAARSDASGCLRIRRSRRHSRRSTPT